MKTNFFLKKIKRLIKDDSKPIDEIHRYWENPQDGTNLPTDYISGDKKSEYLLEKIKNYSKELKILEIGCNVGRNLNFLYKNGYKTLTGIEISSNALEVMKKTFNDTYKDITIYNLPVEEYFIKNEKDRYDLIFTMAVLEHIHIDSEWIFKSMVDQTNKYILTIEDESSISWKHFPRNYKKIFEKLNMSQIDYEECFHVDSLHKGFIYRLFEKNEQ